MSERLDEQQLDALRDHTEYGHLHGEDYDAIVSLIVEVRALRAERDRLRDGIAAHREGVRRSVPYGEWLAADERLWSLLDGKADDE